MRVLVCGSYAESIFVGFVLDKLHAQFGIGEVIHAGSAPINGIIARWAMNNSIPATRPMQPTMRQRTFRMFAARPDMVLVFNAEGPNGWQIELSDQIFFTARDSQIPIGVVDLLSGEIHAVGRGWGSLARRLAAPKRPPATLSQIEVAIHEGAVGAFEKLAAR